MGTKIPKQHPEAALCRGRQPLSSYSGGKPNPGVLCPAAVVFFASSGFFCSAVYFECCCFFIEEVC